MAAQVKILIEGYTNADSKAETGEEKTRATISLVKDGDLVMVIDPGVLESQQILVDALEKEGLSANDVNVVCITHSHIDHYRNIGMFPNARSLDYFGIWDKNVCDEWQEQFSPNIQILRTPGHDYTGITLFVATDEGVVAICGDVFWKENYPEEDIYATNPQELKKSRELVSKMADWIIPGHAGMYKAKADRAADRESIERKRKEQEIFAICKKCKRPILSKYDSCRCRPYLCYHCCECGIDCDLCNCSHKKSNKNPKKFI